MAQAIVPRDLDVDFSQVPRHWAAGSAVATAISNGVNMLFPHGERFFVRSVKYFLDRIEDPVLRAQVKGSSVRRAGTPTRTTSSTTSCGTKATRSISSSEATSG